MYNYYAKFNRDGERETSIALNIHFANKEELQMYLDQGFVPISDHEQKLYASGQYIRGENGKAVEKPSVILTIEEIIAQKLAVLDTEYQPQFQELQLAWAAASMDGNTELAAGIQQDYLALKTEYQTKKEAIINGNS